MHLRNLSYTSFKTEPDYFLQKINCCYGEYQKCIKTQYEQLLNILYFIYIEIQLHTHICPTTQEIKKNRKIGRRLNLWVVPHWTFVHLILFQC